MWECRDEVAVAGIGYSSISRGGGKPLASLALESFDAALADAGLRRDQIDGLITYPDQPRYGGERGTIDGLDIVTTRLAARLLGISDTARYQLDSFSGGIFGAFGEAVCAVAAGACSYALVWRAVHAPEGRFNDYRQQFVGGDGAFSAPYGFTMPAAHAAANMQRYLNLSGCSREDFGRFVVRNRQNTNRSPRAYFYDKPLTLDDYLDGRMISDPCSIFDCDIPVDGCAAVVVTTTERARDLPNVPALVKAFGATEISKSRGIPPNCCPDDLWNAAEALAAQLWAASGLGPKDIDVAQFYDGFSVMACAFMEGMGFAPRGEGLRSLDEENRIGGTLPINTAGGVLGEGRLHGMGQIAEAALQVMGRAGSCQAPNVAHSLATFAVGTHGIIFGRDDA